MGGIKHSKWNMDPTRPRIAMPTNMDDPVAMAAWAQMDVMANCKICGGAIMLEGSLQDPDGGASAREQWKEEREAGMHKACYLNYMRAQQMRGQ